MRKISFIVAVVFCMLLLFGCAGGTEPAASADAVFSEPEASAAQTGGDAAQAQTGAGNVIEPEQLISAEEAERLLGEPVLDGDKKEQPAVGQKTCIYGAQDSESKYFLQVSVTQQSFMDGSQTPESIYKAIKDAVADPSDQPEVPGIGNEYFIGAPGLHILTDGVYLVISAGNTDDEKTREILKSAGSLAVENLHARLG